ncbi:hypothetical protein [Xenorhabdus thuongxuanensis]|nr:hypothetical protein [Xenorhabdus thuongxuanensis]OKP00586.1 PalA [Xenorhabdus thuongxuanensis]
MAKAGASIGYTGTAVIKVPMDKVLNPISKQYEWVPTGVWTITKPVKQNPIPNIIGNTVGSATTESTVNSLSKKEVTGEK